jgi:hypothetical protein
MMTALTGYYSFRAAQIFGYTVYRTPNGETVKVTEVTDDDKPLTIDDDLVPRPGYRICVPGVSWTDGSGYTTHEDDRSYSYDRAYRLLFM